MARKQDDELGDGQRLQLTQAILEAFRNCDDTVSLEDCGGGYWQMNVKFRMENLIDGLVEHLKGQQTYIGRGGSGVRDPMAMARMMVFALNKAQYEHDAKQAKAGN